MFIIKGKDFVIRLYSPHLQIVFGSCPCGASKSSLSNKKLLDSEAFVWRKGWAGAYIGGNGSARGPEQGALLA